MRQEQSTALQSIERLLAEQIGLSPESVGTSAIEHAVLRRMRCCALADREEYLVHLDSPGELDALVEEVAVPETWFFRDRPTFSFLADYTVNHWQPRHPGEQLRALSLPCGSGEEAYSIAMALARAGLDHFSVLAVDIRRSALEVGRQARYTGPSFRGDEDGFRHFFVAEPGGWLRVVPEVVERVRFCHGNACDPALLASHPPFDIVFCRNLMIYLTPEMRSRLSATVARLLCDDGLLLAGYAETELVWRECFLPLRETRLRSRTVPPSSWLAGAVPGEREDRDCWGRGTKLFVFRKASAQECRTAPPLGTVAPPAATTAVAGTPPRPRGRATARLRSAPGAPTGKPVEPVVRPQARLEAARRLADLEHFSEAAALCEEQLAEHPDCADAYFLLGVLCQAGGEAQRAAEQFLKVIYLDPHHYEALTWLTLLHEERGDRSSAATFRRRAERAMLRAQTQETGKP